VWAFNLLADVIRDVSGEHGRALLAERTARRAAARTKEKIS
jgi:peptide/nickel transport system permease protein